MQRSERSKIIRFITVILERKPLSRVELIKSCINKFNIGEHEKCDTSLGSKCNLLRSMIGECINEMHASSLIAIDNKGRYYLVTTRPIVIRIEKCEKEIVKALSEKPLSQTELRIRLTKIFGTNKTSSRRDDDILSTYIGQLLKKLLSYGTLTVSDGVYSLSEKTSANIGNINEIMALKSEFIEKLHSKGGEFFENYFMELLSRYTKKQGKKVLECYVTGGSADGGIDGVMRTEDSLGFREVTMVQTKNRVEIATETDLRGFYGAVWAKRGTRGIYAITSDFHSSAISFIKDLDDCVGINGDRIFSMAIECLYGIKKVAGKYQIDTKIL